MNYFDRFQRTEYSKDGQLPLKGPSRILWVDEDMLEGMSLRKSIEPVIRYAAPIIQNFDIDHCGQDDAVDELVNKDYSLVILDNDSYRGVSKGPGTLAVMRDLDEDIPIVYTIEDTSQLSEYHRRMVQEVVPTSQLVGKICEYIEKYMEV